MVALVDDEDYEYLSQWKWCAMKAKHTFYAVRGASIESKSTTIFMHWDVMGGKGIDHKDHNGLHNWRYNLRFCTQGQNLMNLSKRKNTSSTYKGVSFNNQTSKWQAYIQIKGRKIHIGYFIPEIEAALAYDARAKELFGDWAYLNFPNASE